MRRIAAVPLKHPPAPLDGGYDDEGNSEPYVEWGDPADLYVDDAYQRPISKRGRTLIKRIAGGEFSWRKFKMPNVTIGSDGRRMVIDGQHTATMAISRGIRNIPWLVIPTLGQADAADSFVSLNMDRTSITAMNEHRARVAAGDADACQVERICKAAGVTLCLFQKKNWNTGETIALAAIRQLVKKRGDARTRLVLDILVKAELAPISADHIKSVDALLNDEEFEGLVKPEKLVALLGGETRGKIEREAAVFADTHRVRKWKGMATKLYQAATRRRAA